MSKELMGADGYAVGSDAYFRRLHERNGVSEWIADGAETDYRKMLRGLAERARRAASAPSHRTAGGAAETAKRF